jgi:hypothetical protein
MFLVRREYFYEANQLERSKTDLKRVSYAINKFLGFLIIYFNSVKVSRDIFKKSRDPIVSFAY